MWFSSARQARRAPLARSRRNTFRPKLEALEDRCLLSAGSLDLTFGSGGTVVSASLASPRAVVVQPDGKIVVAGNQWTLERFNPDGSVDTTFGTAGTGIVSNVTLSNGGILTGLAIDANGDIMAVGATLGSTSDSVTAVARYKPDGSLDPTFGNGQGFVLTNVNPYSKGKDFGHEEAEDVAIQGDGKIVVCGTMSATALYALSNFYLVRFNADGTLDNSFGKNGINITAPFGGNGDYSTALALQSDGKILVAGTATDLVSTKGKVYNYTSMAVARYTPSGQLDSSFGAAGTVTLDPSGIRHSSASDLLVQSNGDIVFYGTNNFTTIGSGTLTLARVKNNGQLDTSFANSGFAASNIVPNSSNRLRGLAEGANGDLLAAGTSNGSMTVAAFLPGGAVDTSFGTGGIATVAFSSSAYTTGMAVQPDGKIVVAGYVSSGSQLALALAPFLPPDTQIGWPTAAPNPVSAGTNVTLTVSNIYDNAYPTTTVTQVSFYQDNNGDGILDSGDILLGTGTLNTTTGVWTFTFSTTGLASGTYTLFAQAGDGTALYAPISIQVAVQ